MDKYLKPPFAKPPFRLSREKLPSLPGQFFVSLSSGA